MVLCWAPGLRAVEIEVSHGMEPLRPCLCFWHGDAVCKTRLDCKVVVLTQASWRCLVQLSGHQMMICLVEGYEILPRDRGQMIGVLPSALR